MNEEEHFNILSPIKKLKNGDYGLAMTYWVFWILASNILALLLSLVYESDNLLLSLITLAFTFIYITIVCIGIWKAANKYEGAKIWANLAKTAVVLFILLILVGMFEMFNAKPSNDLELAKKLYTAGNMYRKGQGVEKDTFKAVGFYQRACDAGSAKGCYSLGLMYYKSLGGLKQDYSKIKILFSKACDNGLAEGCYNVGDMYAEGKGVDRNHTKAKELFNKACGDGLAEGCKRYSELK